MLVLSYNRNDQEFYDKWFVSGENKHYQLKDVHFITAEICLTAVLWFACILDNSLLHFLLLVFLLLLQVHYHIVL
jgi:hypothetical protein